jgi:hypothetical protein
MGEWNGIQRSKTSFYEVCVGAQGRKQFIRENVPLKNDTNSPFSDQNGLACFLFCDFLLLKHRASY